MKFIVALTIFLISCGVENSKTIGTHSPKLMEWFDSISGNRNIVGLACIEYEHTTHDENNEPVICRILHCGDSTSALWCKVDKRIK